MLKRLTKEAIKMIRREVLGGKSKYQVAKEMEVTKKTVYYHTGDEPI